jgi:glycosyl hydrolase family 59/glycosyl hydrolase family 59 (putative galactocerebrosidase)
MLKLTALALLGTLIVPAGPVASADPPVAEVTIDGRDPGRTFQGIGAESSGGTSRLLYDYPEPQRSQILDYLFLPNYGASLQLLKVEIGGDANSSNGSEASHRHTRDEQNLDRGYEWWLMREAKRRNPSIVLSALEWSVPGWVGDGDYFSQDNLDYIVDFLKGARQQHGLTIDYVGTVNEPRIIHQAVDWGWVKRLKRAITSDGLHAKLVVGDDPRRGCCPSNLPWDDVNAMAADPELAAAVDVIGSHYAGGVVPAEAYRFGKPIWSTEDGPWTDGWNEVVGGSYAPFGSMYNLNYIDGKLTSTNIWNLVTAYYDNLIFPNSGLMRAAEPWSGHYQVSSPVWITAHTTQFARPGWRYLDGASKRLPGGASMVSLRSPTGDYSSIFETQRAEQPTTVRVAVRGGLSAGTVHVWMSTKDNQFARQAAIPVRDGHYELTLAPGAVYSVTTTTGQHKGNATPPPAKPFPADYRDDFENGRLGQQPRYLAQMAGSYELTPCVGRPGRCVEQVVGEQPVEWFQAYPTAYLGDSWADSSVEVKIRHGLEGAAEVWGRIGNNGAHSQGISMPKLPDGYYLSVQKTGRWYLGKTVDGERRQLASGFVELPADTWHTIKITFAGPVITAAIDGHQVGSATDSTYTSGRAGIGTGWNRVQFDDFTVTQGS